MNRAEQLAEARKIWALQYETPEAEKARLDALHESNLVRLREFNERRANRTDADDPTMIDNVSRHR